jgi:hypothetical protein
MFYIVLLGTNCCALRSVYPITYQFLLLHALVFISTIFTPWGARPHTIACRPFVCVGPVDGGRMFFPISRRAPFWVLRQTYMNEWINRPVALVTDSPCPWGPW